METPRIAEIDFQRERLRRELSEVINVLDEAASSESERDRTRADMMVALRISAVDPTKYIEAAVQQFETVNDIKGPFSEGGASS